MRTVFIENKELAESLHDASPLKLETLSYEDMAGRFARRACGWSHIALVPCPAPLGASCVMCIRNGFLGVLSPSASA